MKKILFILVIVILFAGFTPANAQEPVAQSDIDLKGFDEFVNKSLKDWEVPGVAVAIIKDGKVILNNGYGYASLSPKKKVNPETLFAIGSTTKAFTSFAIGQLVEKGKVDLDKPVRDYMPLFKMDEEYKSNHITIRDVLSHRTGLPAHNGFYYHPQFTRNELVEKIQYLETNHELREAWQYSNIMYAVAGCLVETVSGNTWEEFVKENILVPLKMNNTNFSADETQKLDNYAKPYVLRKRKLMEIPYENVDVMGPAGSINSNIVDMSNWVEMQLKSPDKLKLNIISAKTLDELHSPNMIISTTPTQEEFFYNGYASAWLVTCYRGTTVIWHNGVTNGFKSVVALLPAQNAGMVILSNRTTDLPEIIAMNLYDRILGKNKIPWSLRIKNAKLKQRNEELKAEEAAKKESAKPASPNMTHPINSYVGTFEHPAYGTITVVEKNKNLLMTYHGEELPLKHSIYDTFTVRFEDPAEGENPDMPVLFQPNEEGSIETISIPFEPQVSNILFKRVKK